uniref:KRAB domain-containing protein n=1 Tax=Ficedula albicollis TaxID=59894 RepID=A0A803VU48_FICAL
LSLPDTGLGFRSGAELPWVLLDPRQKALYLDVMHESYETLMALGKDSSAGLAAHSSRSPEQEKPLGSNRRK